ncbi:hypothetical protein ES332_D01G044300v1 [Gossypium tomentosum]|uniref:Uncharacterized protein n=1 Tax=Gossypium tomentosum TaxID=34277 RepID=A0A5D2M598_GOSTO|nr:hypothetical protein ES332_D01G044300v1 [Gossypium tomentosum]
MNFGKHTSWVEGSIWKISLSACSISTFPSRVSLFLHIFFFYIMLNRTTNFNSLLLSVLIEAILFEKDLSKQCKIWKNWVKEVSVGVVAVFDGHNGAEAIASCLLLPAIQLVVGISHPSWISLTFFIGSCIRLVDWSLTSNFLGLFRLWKALQFYAGFSIFMLYVYQLRIEFSSMLQWIADFVGLFKICSTSEWTEICSSVSLVLYYIMVCTSFITIGLILFKNFS